RRAADDGGRIHRVLLENVDRSSGFYHVINGEKNRFSALQHRSAAVKNKVGRGSKHQNSIGEKM
ncbi:hypothetical protein, partial [Burkholderia glumae]